MLKLSTVVAAAIIGLGANAFANEVPPHAPVTRPAPVVVHAPVATHSSAPVTPAPTSLPAKPPEAATPPKTVVLSLDSLNQLFTWIHAVVGLRSELQTPSLLNAIAAINACIADNPVNGVVVRQGPDNCPDVTAALKPAAK